MPGRYAGARLLLPALSDVIGTSARPPRRARTLVTSPQPFAQADRTARRAAGSSFRLRERIASSPIPPRECERGAAAASPGDLGALLRPQPPGGVLAGCGLVLRAPPVAPRRACRESDNQSSPRRARISEPRSGSSSTAASRSGVSSTARRHLGTLVRAGRSLPAETNEPRPRSHVHSHGRSRSNPADASRATTGESPSTRPRTLEPERPGFVGPGLEQR